METLAPSTTYRHTRIRITTTAPLALVDITDRLKAAVIWAGIDTGFINIQSLHTTTAIVVNEHEPLLLEDIAAFLDRLAPHHAGYRHDDFSARTVNLVPGERKNGHAHCRALVLGTSTCLNIASGALQLGRWQRVFLAEMDGPQARELSVLIVGEGRS